MLSVRILFLVCPAIAGLSQPAWGDTYPLILQGKVTMSDGSPAPKGVSIERICSNDYGSEPGPVTNNKGEYVWRIEVNPLLTRVCTLRAHLNGYASTEIDISGFNSYSNPKLPPLVLTPSHGDPTVIGTPESGVPAKALAAWNKGIKAIDGGDMATAIAQFQAVVAAVPKFAPGWNALGLVYGTQAKAPESRDAWEHAIAADPKLLPPYVNLARLCVALHDWNCAAKNSDALLKLDVKRQYPEMYLHQAVARFELKDLSGAEASVGQALKLDSSRKGARAEYVLGRILLAKGDTAGAREHISKYLQLNPNAADVEKIRAELQSLNQSESAPEEPDLELP